MIHRLTLFGSLFYCFVSLNTFSQQKLTKDEILKEYRLIQNDPNLDSLFRWDIHLQTRVTLDNLLKSGIDTLLVYTIRLPGYVTIGRDSCSLEYQLNSHFFWKDHGKYFYKKINGRCESPKVNATEKVIQFSVDNHLVIREEFFMGVIYGAEKNGDQLKVSEYLINHEPKYSILILVSKQDKYLTFTEDGLKNKKSLFLDYNKGLTSFKLYELIEGEILN